MLIESAIIAPGGIKGLFFSKGLIFAQMMSSPVSRRLRPPPRALRPRVSNDLKGQQEIKCLFPAPREGGQSYVALLNLVESEKDGPSREVRGCCLNDTSWNNAQASPARPLRAIRALIQHLARADAQHAGVK
jgi:hypothetical protein